MFKLINHIFIIPPQGLKTLDYILFKLYDYPKESILEISTFKNDIIDVENNKLLYNFLEGNKKITFNKTDLAEKHFDHCLHYFRDKRLIVYNGVLLAITLEGIIKKETGGFVKDYKRKVFKNRLQHFYWLVSLIAIILSLYLAYLKILVP